MSSTHTPAQHECSLQIIPTNEEIVASKSTQLRALLSQELHSLPDCLCRLIAGYLFIESEMLAQIKQQRHEYNVAISAQVTRIDNIRRCCRLSSFFLMLLYTLCFSLALHMLIDVVIPDWSVGQRMPRWEKTTCTMQKSHVVFNYCCQTRCSCDTYCYPPEDEPANWCIPCDQALRANQSRGCCCGDVMHKTCNSQLCSLTMYETCPCRACPPGPCTVDNYWIGCEPLLNNDIPHEYADYGVTLRYFCSVVCGQCSTVSTNYNISYMGRTFPTTQSTHCDLLHPHCVRNAVYANETVEPCWVLPIQDSSLFNVSFAAPASWQPNNSARTAFAVFALLALTALACIPCHLAIVHCTNRQTDKLAKQCQEDGFQHAHVTASSGCSIWKTMDAI